MLQDPDFSGVNAKAIERLCASAGRKTPKLRHIRETLIIFGVAEDPDVRRFV
jgi:hypothetical protein